MCSAPLGCGLSSGDPMDANEYQRLALNTAPRALSITARLMNAALGLAGESGEFADSLKKHVYHLHSLDAGQLAEELGDVLWYVALASDALGLTISDVMEANVEKLRRRYPDGFDPARSINRS